MRGMFPGPCSFFSPICHSWWYQQKNLGTSLTQPTYPLPLQPSLWPESFSNRPRSSSFISEETEEDSCTSFSRVSLSISSLLLALWDRNGLCLSRGGCTYIYIYYPVDISTPVFSYSRAMQYCTGVIPQALGLCDILATTMHSNGELLGTFVWENTRHCSGND